MIEQSISKSLLDKAGIIPRLQLGIKEEGGGVNPTGPHTVKFIKDKVVQGKHPITGKEREEVEYTFEEEGVVKTYNTAVNNDEGELSYFVQRMAEYEYGIMLVLEMKKKGIKNYIDISPINLSNADEIPTIESEVDDLSLPEGEDFAEDVK